MGLYMELRATSEAVTGIIIIDDVIAAKVIRERMLTAQVVKSTRWQPKSKALWMMLS